MARLTGVLAAAAACLAVTVAAVVSLAGCTPASGAASSSAGGQAGQAARRRVGRVAVADLRDRADHVRDRLRRHLLADPGAQRLERQPPRPAGHPAVPAGGGQRPARAAGRQPAGQIRRLRRHRPGRGVDGRVRLGGLDHPAPGRQVPAGGLPAAGRRHRPVPGPAVRGPLLQQRRPALLPLRHPQGRRTRSRPRPGRSCSRWPPRWPLSTTCPATRRRSRRTRA